MSAVLARLFDRPAQPRDVVYAGNAQAGFARDSRDVDAARQLRQRLLADHAEPIDALEDLCDHLLVRARDTGQVVGTCRVLRPSRAKRAGGLRIERAFDFSSLAPLRDGMVELSECCIDPAVRSGPVMMLMWSALARYLACRGLRHAVGSVALPLADGGHYAAGAWRAVARHHLAPDKLRLRPRAPMAIEALPEGADPVLPPLVKGWLRAGGLLLGEPNVHPGGSHADMPMLLDRIQHAIARTRRRAGCHPGRPRSCTSARPSCWRPP